MTIDGIVTKVRAIMNEVGDEDSLHLLSDDTVKLTEYIKSVVPDAINMVLYTAPLRCINTSLSNGEASYTSSSLVIPLDFLRLAAIKFKEWKRSVSYVYPMDSEMYKIQHNPITTSGVNKPCCVFSYSISDPVIECFPPGVLEYFHYVKSASAEIDSGLGIVKEELFSSVCYMCAYIIYNIFEIPNTGERMKTIATELIPKA